MPRHRFLAPAAALAALGVVAGLIVMSRRPPSPVTRAPELLKEAFPVPPAPARPLGQLRANVATALGYGGSAPLPYRTRLVRDLPGDLTAIELDALLTALMEKCPPHIKPGQHAAYLHEIANVLHGYPQTRERFASALVTLARDTSRDTSTRDYAVQHLRQTVSRAGDNPALRTAIMGVLREFTRLDPVIANEALLSLHFMGSPAAGVEAPRNSAATGLHGPVARVPDAEMATLLEPIFAKGNSQGIIARLTAVRIVGERRLRTFRPALLQAVSDGTENMMVRKSAAQALARMADPAERTLLAALEPGDAGLRAILRQANPSTTSH